jgi:hypothetical protein
MAVCHHLSECHTRGLLARASRWFVVRGRVWEWVVYQAGRFIQVDSFWSHRSCIFCCQISYPHISYTSLLDVCFLHFLLYIHTVYCNNVKRRQLSVGILAGRGEYPYSTTWCTQVTLKFIRIGSVINNIGNFQWPTMTTQLSNLLWCRHLDPAHWCV